MTGGHVSNNTAKKEGGALFQSGGGSTLDSVVVDYNSAQERGGAIHYVGLSISVTGCDFSANTAPFGAKMSAAQNSSYTVMGNTGFVIGDVVEFAM